MIIHLHPSVHPLMNTAVERLSLPKTIILRKWIKYSNFQISNISTMTLDNQLQNEGDGVWSTSAMQNEKSINKSMFLQLPSFRSPFSNIGKRFFGRLTNANIQTAQQQNSTLSRESWRQIQSEDTYDLDSNILELLTMDPRHLPKPCDPLTYCFWRHGLKRCFESISDYSFENTHFQFTVCSYNVLCQRTLCNYVQKLYSHCPFEHLTWQRRWPLLSVEFQMLNADVFCLQEVQHDHFEHDYMPFFSRLGYDGTFKKKLGTKCDGCATFWRRDKFQAILIYPVEYVFPTPYDHSDGVALITVLEPTSTVRRDGKSNRLIVANTHLIYQPACGATKLCQTALLLAHLQKVSHDHRSDLEFGTPSPVILCGDFNSTPYSPLYSLLINGALRYQGLNGWSISGQQERPQNQYSTSIRLVRSGLNSIGDQILGPALLPRGSSCTESCTLIDHKEKRKEVDDGHLCHNLKFRSIYDHVTNQGEREVTTFLRDQPVAVDYIFYTGRDKETETSKLGEVKENGLKCLERYRLPGPSHLNKEIGYLPNQYCPSDHLPLMAKFALD